jgi:cobalt-zinc-cadmium efflux system protein
MSAISTHDHAHTHAPLTGAKFRVALGLTALMLLVELVSGLAAHSLALLSDAGHVFTDLIALGLAWFAAAQANRPANARKTYGYHRTGILVALVNAVAIIAVVGGIAVEAAQRLRHPEPVTPWLMILAAAVGVAANLYIGFGLRAESAHNLNVRAAMLHVFGDVAASVGVILGALIILLTGWQIADPLISLGIAVIIAISAWGVLRETVDILMEATPRGVNVDQLVGEVTALEGVTGVHDLHVWSIAGGMRLLSAHVQVAKDCSMGTCDDLLGTINRVLHDHYAIGHATIQFEGAPCAAPDRFCAIMDHEPERDGTVL